MSAPSTRPAPSALDHLASQRVFRVLLDALARPGTVGTLPADLLRPDVLEGAGPAALLVPLALADLEVSLAVLELADPGWAGGLAAATGARPAPPEQADLVVGLRAPRPDEVRGLRRGSADRPDLGCRLVLACTALGTPDDTAPSDTGPGNYTAPGDLVCDLAGPGVDGSAELAVGGLPVETVEALVAVNRKFPLGVDTFLVAADGRVAGLPRSTQIRIRARSGSWGRS